MAELELKKMSVVDLLRLQEAIEKLLPQKIEAEKRELKKNLRLIEKFERTNGSRYRNRPHPLNGIKVQPKYRCPDSGATWSGRGRQPRWLTAAIKAGGKRDDFLIADI